MNYPLSAGATVNGLIQRPDAVFDPAKGLLRNEHFQVAYVTRNLAHACQTFQGRFGIREFGALEGEMPSGGYIKIRLAWVGNTMYELVACTGPGSEMYNSELGEGDSAIHFHHLGFLVPDHSCWNALLAKIEDGGWTITQMNNTEGFMRHCYIHVPEVGHHFEFMLPEAAGLEFLQQVPAS